MKDTNFEERSAWIQLVSLLIALGAYFAVAITMAAKGVTALPAYVPVFVVAIVLLVALLALGHILAVIGGHETPDERDRIIGWKAEHHSGWLLGAGVLVAICGLILAVAPVWVAHFLLLCLFGSELLKNALQIVYYRQGV